MLVVFSGQMLAPAWMSCKRQSLTIMLLATKGRVTACAMAQ
jgi:hypothetical protein